MEPLPTGMAQSCLIVAEVAVSQILTSLFIGVIGRVLRHKARVRLGERSSPRRAATLTKALREGRLSSSVRYWPVASVIAGLILLSPVVAFLMVISAEMLIDLLKAAGATSVWPVAAVALWWVLLRKYGQQPYGSRLGSEGA